MATIRINKIVMGVLALVAGVLFVVWHDDQLAETNQRLAIEYMTSDASPLSGSQKSGLGQHEPRLPAAGRDLFRSGTDAGTHAGKEKPVDPNNWLHSSDDVQRVPVSHGPRIDPHNWLHGGQRDPTAPTQNSGSPTDPENWLHAQIATGPLKPVSHGEVVDPKAWESGEVGNDLKRAPQSAGEPLSPPELDFFEGRLN